MSDYKYTVSETNALAVVSLILGILAIPFSFLIIGIFFAGLAITFALLSRGGRRMCGIATAGLTCALIALLIVFAFVLLILVHFSGPAMRTLPAFGNSFFWGYSGILGGGVF